MQFNSATPINSNAPGIDYIEMIGEVYDKNIIYSLC